MVSPKVWSRFEVTRKDGTVLKLRIEDATKERDKEVVDFLMKNFIPKENMWRASGIPKSEESMKHIREFIEDDSGMQPYVQICCLDNEEDRDTKIVATSSIHLSKRDEKEDFDFGGEVTEEIEKLFKLIEYSESRSDVFGYFEVDSYYGGWGVSVDPAFAGYGIATRLFHTRAQVCEEQNVPLTGAWMTAIGSQKAAAKAGFFTLREIPWKEFIRETDGDDIENPPESIKYMVRTIGDVKRREA